MTTPVLPVSDEPQGVSLFSAEAAARIIARAMSTRCVFQVSPYAGDDDRYLVEVAGSIRRCKPLVKDIEIVAVPRWYLEPDTTDLLGERHFERNDLYRSWAVAQSVIKWIKPGTKEIVPWQVQEDGKYWRGYIPSLTVFGKSLPDQACKVDIFLATPENFGLIYLIRTGSAEFSTEIATYALRVGFKVDGGFLWRVRGKRQPELVPTRAEADVFRALNIEWMEPFQRRTAADVRSGWDENTFQHSKLFERFPEM